MVITTEAELRAVLGGEATPLVKAKVATKLNSLTRQFIERSPFLCLATSDASGTCDVSPRGDPRGFVRIIDDSTLLIPERPGNKLADSLRNILANPNVGLLFFIPGVEDTFRVNGRATLITDQSLLSPCAVEGKTPKLGIHVEIRECFTHCSKAFIRSGFWKPENFVTRDSLPTNGQILNALSGGAIDSAEHDRERAARYARRENFY
ncbi:MAG: pyridoxamine 5'-phosphate oxidase family protein [Archangium sp.]